MRLPDNCRFEHPGGSSNPFGGANSNRFGALSSGGGGGSNNRDTQSKYRFTKESVRVDLTDERPWWILSSYGPGKEAPDQLFGGYPQEQSFEEIRLLVQSASNPQEAVCYNALPLPSTLVPLLTPHSYKASSLYINRPSSRYRTH